MIKFVVGVALLIIGYAAVYAGLANLKNGGQGPGFFESLGLSKTLTTPHAIGDAAGAIANGSANQTGQTPQPGGAQTGPVTV